MTENREGLVEGLYLPSLDGLRFFAFCLVLIHHMPRYEGSVVLSTINTYGWVGVELFFVISAFLFFYLLNAEYTRIGKISYYGFYIRRLLRIYPLMIAFPILCLIMYGSPDGLGLFRLAALALFSDNMAVWIAGYDASIPFTPHLWSLSFEFQIYIWIPILYSIYATNGRAMFARIMVAALFVSIALRVVFYGLGAAHPVIWVTPFLRPESIIFGILLSVFRPAWHWLFSGALFLISGTLFISTMVPWDNAWANAVQYPLAAFTCVCLVDLSIKSKSIRHVLSSKILSGLGTISFGLYVFHFWVIHLGDVLLDRYMDPERAIGAGFRYALHLCFVLAVTTALAAISYRYLEKPFLQLKKRYSKVDGRAHVKNAQLEQAM